MKKEIILMLCLAFFFSSCDLINSRGKKKLDPETLFAEMTGTWRLNQAGADEIWHFASDRTYVKIMRYDEEYGTWGFDGKQVILTDMKTKESVGNDVVLDNNILILNSTSLMKDSLAVREVEEKLSEKLVGIWKSQIDDTEYEFRANNFMLVRYADEMTEDGFWKIEGNQLIENELASSKAPVYFDDNQMQWSAQTFNRIGDVDPSQVQPVNNPKDGVIEIKGQAIDRHSFNANLGNFGRVTFAPHWEDRFGASKVHYYLTRNGTATYELPPFGNAKGKFEGLRSVAARDVNSDGKLDIIVMADYVQNGPDNKEQVDGINGIYINKGSSFVFDAKLSQKANSGDAIRNINDILALTKSQNTTSGTTTGGSKTTAKAGTTVSIAKYKGDNSICRIRVSSLKGTIDYNKIGQLSDLGILSFEPADNGFTRVYLGKYLGKYTAHQILRTVKSRGFSSAFVVVDENFINKLEEGQPAYSTYQVASGKRPNVKTLNELGDQFRDEVYLNYSGGNYRTSLGVYQKSIYPFLEAQYSGLAESLNYGGGFSKLIK